MTLVISNVYRSLRLMFTLVWKMMKVKIDKIMLKYYKWKFLRAVKIGEIIKLKYEANGGVRGK